MESDHQLAILELSSKSLFFLISLAFLWTGGNSLELSLGKYEKLWEIRLFKSGIHKWKIHNFDMWAYFIKQCVHILSSLLYIILHNYWMVSSHHKVIWAIRPWRQSNYLLLPEYDLYLCIPCLPMWISSLFLNVAIVSAISSLCNMFQESPTLCVK